MENALVQDSSIVSIPEPTKPAKKRKLKKLRDASSERSPSPKLKEVKRKPSDEYMSLPDDFKEKDVSE